MRLNKRLLVDGKQVPLVSDYVRLRLNEVGDGIFEVQDLPGRKGNLVGLYVSVGDSQEYLMMTGALVETRLLAKGRLRIAARELSTVLEMPIMINLPQCTAREVVAEIEEVTGLRFLLPAGADYLDERRVGFKHFGQCLGALNSLAKRWDLVEAVWFQLPDGRMYWGHWASSPYTKAPLPIEAGMISQMDEKNKTLVLPYIPALRPGMVVKSEFRFRIDGLTFAGDTVKVDWKRV